MRNFNLTPVTKWIIIINVIVFILQIFSPFINNTFPLYPYGSDNFLLTQYLTACFSHGNFIHLFLNMFVFQSFGNTLENRFGSKQFLSFYLSVGILANIMWHLIQDVGVPGLGASGALYGVLALFVILYPNNKLSIVLLPFSFKAIHLFSFFIILELILALSGFQDGIGHVVHLSGAFIGTIYYILFLKTKRDFVGKTAGMGLNQKRKKYK
jgi:membrane associated rhomboid family serine protease